MMEGWRRRSVKVWRRTLDVVDRGEDKKKGGRQGIYCLELTGSQEVNEEEQRLLRLRNTHIWKNFGQQTGNALERRTHWRRAAS